MNDSFRGTCYIGSFRNRSFSLPENFQQFVTNDAVEIRACLFVRGKLAGIAERLVERCSPFGIVSERYLADVMLGLVPLHETPCQFVSLSKFE